MNLPSAPRQEKSKTSPAQVGWSLVVLVWLPMAALLVWGRGGILDLMALRKEVQQLQTEATALEQENARIRAEIQKLQTDPSTYEALARERFFLKKPGERVLYIPPSALLPADPAPAPGQPSRKNGGAAPGASPPPP